MKANRLKLVLNNGSREKIPSYISVRQVFIKEQDSTGHIHWYLYSYVAYDVNAFVMDRPVYILYCGPDSSGSPVGAGLMCSAVAAATTQEPLHAATKHRPE